MAAPAAGLEAMRAYAASGGVGAVELGLLCALRESAEALSTTLAGVPETRDAALTAVGLAVLATSGAAACILVSDTFYHSEKISRNLY